MKRKKVLNEKKCKKLLTRGFHYLKVSVFICVSYLTFLPFYFVLSIILKGKYYIILITAIINLK